MHKDSSIFTAVEPIGVTSFLTIPFQPNDLALMTNYKISQPKGGYVKFTTAS